jgi:hypothetical protein
MEDISLHKLYGGNKNHSGTCQSPGQHGRSWRLVEGHGSLRKVTNLVELGGGSKKHVEDHMT